MGAVLLLLACALARAEGELEPIAAAVRTGDQRAALGKIALLPDETRADDAVRYLEGRLLLGTGRPCDAMDLLSDVPSSLPDPMRQDMRRRWANAAAQCGQCEEARPVLLGTTAANAKVTRHDRAVAADCAVRLGELDAAAEELDRLTKRARGLPNRVTLLALLSEVYEDLERPEDAKAAALEAWRSAVRPSERAIADKLADRAAPSPRDRIVRARNLVRDRSFARAVEELEAIDVSDDEALEREWLHEYGMALFRMRTRYLDSARVLHRSASKGGPHEAEDAFHSARALSRADEDARAIRAYRRFAQRYPRSRYASQARFLAAWLEIRLRRASGAKQMERLVRGKRQVYGRWRRAALWELGFRAVETRRYARAVRYLKQYTALATTGMDEARGHYWLGRAYRRGPKAVDSYRDAIAVEPLHWYAVLAAQRLKRLGAEIPAPFESAVELSALQPPDTVPTLPDTFVAYQRLGLDSEGIAWLGANEARLVAEYPKSERIPALTQLYREAGAYRDALLVARRRMVYLRSDPAEQRWWWDAAYPMPWRATIDAHRGELPVALIYATMRQESGFRPEVVSPAGAVGLMQVMPELAAKLAGKPVSRYELRDPDINIALGLEEMAALAEEFRDVYPLSIAAYNAGKSRVRRWLRESKRMELDRFVERIPFNETRNYVRRVSSHYARYAYLDDPEAGWPELPAFVSP